MERLSWQCKKWIPLDENAEFIYPEMVRKNGFAVRNTFGQRLNKDGTFEYEQKPVDRDGEFLSRCRFSDIQSAQDAYEKWKENEQPLQLASMKNAIMD